MAASLTSVISANILPKRLKISKHTNYLTVAKSLVLVTSVNILPKRLNYLKTHKLTHSGEKPYACDYSVIKSNCNKPNLYFEAFTSEFSYFQVINLIRILGGFVLTPPWPCSSSLGAESDPLPG